MSELAQAREKYRQARLAALAAAKSYQADRNAYTAALRAEIAAEAGLALLVVCPVCQAEVNARCRAVNEYRVHHDQRADVAGVFAIMEETDGVTG